MFVGDSTALLTTVWLAVLPSLTVQVNFIQHNGTDAGLPQYDNSETTPESWSWVTASQGEESKSFYQQII